MAANSSARHHDGMSYVLLLPSMTWSALLTMLCAYYGSRVNADGDMKMVVKKKTNKQRTKIPPMSEERIRELNEIM